MGSQVEKWIKDKPILHGKLNLMVEAFNFANALQIDASSRLKLYRTGTGSAIRGTGRGDFAVYAKVTTAISAAAGDKLGKGMIKLQDRDDEGNLTPVEGGPDPCFNSSLATVAVGQVIQAKWVGGRLGGRRGALHLIVPTGYGATATEFAHIR